MAHAANPPKLPVVHTDKVEPVARVGDTITNHASLVKTVSAEEVELATGDELDLDWLVAEVIARNPSLQPLIYAWQSASQRYPQAVSLDDSMMTAMFAPQSVGSPDVETAYALEGSQKLPWFGKRTLRGERADAQADMAAADAGDYKQQLVCLAVPPMQASAEFPLACDGKPRHRDIRQQVARYERLAQLAGWALRAAWTHTTTNATDGSDGSHSAPGRNRYAHDAVECCSAGNRNDHCFECVGGIAADTVAGIERASGAPHSSRS
jgi:hypothetical protein